MPQTIEKLIHLRKIHLFDELLVEDLLGIARVAEEVRFATGDTILREGDVGDGVCLVVSGEVRVLVGEREVRRLGAGECFGEMALLDQERRSASVLAATDVAVLWIGQDDFYDLLAEKSAILQGIIRVLVKRLRHQGAPC